MGALNHVNPNRMELLRLRKRRALASRGHKLLKDKQEQLVRVFLSLIEEVRSIRTDCEAQLSGFYESSISASAECDSASIEDAILSSTRRIDINVKYQPIMNLRVPIFDLKTNDGKFNYGYSGTTGDLDAAFAKLEKLIPTMLKLAEKEKALHMIARELVSTRRRVSALEHIFIPRISDTIRGITSKLSELERSASVRLMKVKDIVRKH